MRNLTSAMFLITGLLLFALATITRIRYYNDGYDAGYRDRVKAERDAGKTFGEPDTVWNTFWIDKRDSSLVFISRGVPVGP